MLPLLLILFFRIWNGWRYEILNIAAIIIIRLKLIDRVKWGISGRSIDLLGKGVIAIVTITIVLDVVVINVGVGSGFEKLTVKGIPLFVRN